MTEKPYQRVATANLPTRFGSFTVYAYSTTDEDTEYLALVMGEITDDPILCRLHSSCLTGDLLGSLRCDCGDQLTLSLEEIGKVGRGVLLYVEQEGRGIGLLNKMKAYELQDGGMDTVEANLALGFQPDERDYETAAEILKELGVKKIRLLTNNPRKLNALTEHGIEVVEIIPVAVPANKHNEKYLETKRSKLGHNF